jgi:hypothetical protein
VEDCLKTRKDEQCSSKKQSIQLVAKKHVGLAPVSDGFLCLLLSEASNQMFFQHPIDQTAKRFQHLPPVSSSKSKLRPGGAVKSIVVSDRGLPSIKSDSKFVATTQRDLYSVFQALWRAAFLSRKTSFSGDGGAVTMAHSLCRNASVSHVVVESSLDASSAFFQRPGNNSSVEFDVTAS